MIYLTGPERRVSLDDLDAAIPPLLEIKGAEWLGSVQVAVSRKATADAFLLVEEAAAMLGVLGTFKRHNGDMTRIERLLVTAYGPLHRNFTDIAKLSPAVVDQATADVVPLAVVRVLRAASLWVDPPSSVPSLHMDVGLRWLAKVEEPCQAAAVLRHIREVAASTEQAVADPQAAAVLRALRSPRRLQHGGAPHASRPNVGE